MAISLRIPLASYVFPHPEFPINKEGCFTIKKDLMNSEVAIVSIVLTVTFPIVSDKGSNSLFSSFLFHSVNLLASPD